MKNKKAQKTEIGESGEILWSSTAPQRPGELYVASPDISMVEDGITGQQRQKEFIVATAPDYFKMPNRPEELGVLSGKVMRVTRRSVETCICGCGKFTNRNYGIVEGIHIVIIECLTQGFMIGTYEPEDN